MRKMEIIERLDFFPSKETPEKRLNNPKKIKLAIILTSLSCMIDKLLAVDENYNFIIEMDGKKRLEILKEISTIKYKYFNLAELIKSCSNREVIKMLIEIKILDVVDNIDDLRNIIYNTTTEHKTDLLEYLVEIIQKTVEIDKILREEQKT